MEECKQILSFPEDEENLNVEEKRFVEDPANADLFHDIPSPVETPQRGTKQTAEEIRGTGIHLQRFPNFEAQKGKTKVDSHYATLKFPLR